jgi:hypothetical protein
MLKETFFPCPLMAMAKRKNGWLIEKQGKRIMGKRIMGRNMNFNYYELNLYMYN